MFLGLHFLHLGADFPNHSPWMDWSKYTDEGWYGDAAIRHFQRGHWYVPGDFNPAVALPMLPLLEALLFAFTGVSLVAARALTVSLFGLSLVAAWVLLARSQKLRSPLQSPPLAASVAVFLLALSPFCFVFTRLAIIEPLLVLLTLVALLVAQKTPHRPPTRGTRATLRANLPQVLALGLLLPLLILTKTTALFLFPAIAWMFFAATGYQRRLFLQLALPAAALGATLWLSYFLLIVRPFYLLDYRYLFSANGYTGMTRHNIFEVLKNTLRGGMWIDRTLFPLAIAALLFALAHGRRLARHPLVVALILWILGYAAFLAYHNNLQPRYYLVIAVPLLLLLPLVFAEMLLPRLSQPAFARARPFAFAAAGVAFSLAAIPDARLTLHYLRHPEYTLLNAADQVRDYILADRQRDPAHNLLVLSISGSDLSLMTGLPSICDDFGTLELGDRVKRYLPGWYLAWNQIDDDKMDAMAPLFHPVRVATFPAMDDPDRNVLVLYRLDPATTAPRKARARSPIPRSLRTKLGQQPSVNQLGH